MAQCNRGHSKLYLLNFKILGHFGYIFRGKIAQRQDQPCQCLLRQSCKNRAVIAAGACGRADSVHAVCAGLHPGTVSGCHILHPKLVCSRQQGGKQRRAAFARKAAEALGIECIVLNAEALAGQNADVLGDGGTPLFAALLTAADKLGMQYVATAHRARVETGADGVHTVCPPAGTGSDDSTILAALPQETLARLILPLGDFAPEDVAEMAEDFKV